MSGHSHWAGIKHKKGLNDAKRAKIFTKLAKPIVIAARDGGGNPKKAQEFNMPKDNIDKAIKKGTGELKSEEIIEVIYEAMGPGNIMMLIKASTDNKNRTVSEVKSILTKTGGKFGETGSVMWNFEQVGNININLKEKNLEEVEMIAIESGAKDIKSDAETLSIITDPKNLQKVQEKLIEKNIEISDAGLAYLPKNIVAVNEKTKASYEKLIEALEEQDDVEEIFDNL